jgi:uncharacterized membrane protein
VLAWLVKLIIDFVGPGSIVGRFFAALGGPFVDSTTLAYLFGTVVLVVVIYVLGLAVQLGLKRPVARFLDVTLRRIPLVGSLYDVADRFVGLLDQNEKADLGAMSPVWCFFGGDGVAVLALACSPDPIEIAGRRYYAVLIPTAPVPIGGGLLYVPVEWVRPAAMGFDKLTAIYVSMGITPPPPEDAGPPAGASQATAKVSDR